jgi:hypothetical protein
MPMRVNRMLADFNDGGREEVVKRLNARGRVGVSLGKLLN